MNDLSATDIILFGALTGALVLTLLGLLWAMAYRGRKRWSAERVGVSTSEIGHIPPRPIPPARPMDAAQSEFYDRASMAGHGGS